MSSDNGQTFSSSGSFGGTFAQAYADKAGTIILNTTNVVMRSINNCLIFSPLPTSLGCTVFSYAGAGRWIGTNPSISTSCYISDNAFSTGSGKALNGTLNGSLSFIDSDINTGVTVIASANGGTLITNLATSYDRGESFGVGVINSAYPILALKNLGADAWLAVCGQCGSTGAYELRKSINGAKTFAQGPVGNTSQRPAEIIADPLKG